MGDIDQKRNGHPHYTFIVKMPNRELTEEDVIRFAKSKMTAFKCPAKVRFVDALPKTLAGKVLKKELRKTV